MNSIGYYPGCSLRGTAAEYDRSLRGVAKRLNVELHEIREWNCCGASSAHAVDHHAALFMAADTLAKACSEGLQEILAPCAMCYQRLALAADEMLNDRSLARRVAGALGERQDLPLDRVKPLNVLNWLGSIPAEQLKACVTKPLKGLKVACYYGCLLLRPPKINVGDDIEAPRSMERLVQAMGAEPVRWSMAMECCGGSFALSRKEVVIRQGLRIYEAARQAGADVMCLACPMCHSNLDLRQPEYTAGLTGSTPVPAVYLTQMLGMAFGMNAAELGLEGHFVPVEPVVTAAMNRTPAAVAAAK
jgi:heterodisulfide reductase subunit B2